jgi:hypothetical protein
VERDKRVGYETTSVSVKRGRDQERK